MKFIVIIMISLIELSGSTVAHKTYLMCYEAAWKEMHMQYLTISVFCNIWFFFATCTK